MTDTNPMHYRYWVVYITKDGERNFGLGSMQFETATPIIHLAGLIEATKSTIGDKPSTFLNWQLVALRHKGEDWRPTHPLAKT